MYGNIEYDLFMQLPNISIGEDIIKRIMFTDNYDLGGSFEWEDEEFDIKGEEERLEILDCDEDTTIKDKYLQNSTLVIRVTPFPREQTNKNTPCETPWEVEAQCLVKIKCFNSENPCPPRYRDLGNNTQRVYGAEASNPQGLRPTTVGQDVLPTYEEDIGACQPLFTKPGTYPGTSGHSGHVLSGAPVYQLVGTTPTTPPPWMPQTGVPPTGSIETTSPGYPPSMALPVPVPWRPPPANPTYQGPKTSFPDPWQPLSSMPSVGGPRCLFAVTAVHGGLPSGTAPPWHPPPAAQTVGDASHTTPAHWYPLPWNQASGGPPQVTQSSWGQPPGMPGVTAYADNQYHPSPHTPCKLGHVWDPTGWYMPLVCGNYPHTQRHFGSY
ncbi:amyloid beta A4 precursor protein-binding family B member 1-interacting protein-like [Mercenaria mercenaria]|uniref:amyloid beta A4 precursor protein-binding family B member 1-interacting protein-like n=1 Tax=Mercenaria mercenaria TaxID=6596 RepID=UPI00234F0F3E|nr:amyloid beta A4 precursor protein-binding family B member 1-interacting protein-like [Mercenaria mercenaria]